MTSIHKRVALALLIVVLDMTVFFVPLTAVLAAYILIMRPKWVIKFVVSLYGVSTTTAKLKDLNMVSDLEKAIKRNEVEIKATTTLREHIHHANEQKAKKKRYYHHPKKKKDGNIDTNTQQQ